MPRVLLCQCAASMEREITEALAERGITVTSCHDGERLLEAMLKDHPDVIVHVLRQDPREDMGVLRLVRHAAPEVPLILLAENGSLEIQRQIIELRPIFYDVVPVGPEDLLDAVQAAIERARTAAPRPRAGARDPAPPRA